MKFTRRQARALAAAERAAQIEARTARTETKWVRAAPEDDDRLRRVDGRVVYANPGYREGTDAGWRCAFNLRRLDGGSAPPELGFTGCAGFFGVTLQSDPAGWTVACFGTDGPTWARTGLDEATARRVYDGIFDQTTRRTLRRRGFAPL